MSRAAACVLLLGCAGAPSEIEEQELPRFAAEVICTRIKECDRASYDSDFFGRGDCIDSQEREIEDIADAASECDYSASGARDAWQEIRDMSCEDFVEGGADEAIFSIWGDCF